MNNSEFLNEEGTLKVPMKKFILVKVPADSSDYFINNVGCLRYSQNEGRESSVVEPMQIGEYLKKEKHNVVGESMLGEQKIVVIEIKP